MTKTITELMESNLHGVFGQRDDDARRTAAQATYTTDVEFFDPESAIVGIDAIVAKAGALLAGAPDFVFTATSPVYESHDLGYLAWSFGPEGHDPVATGMDIATVRDGLIATLHTVVTS